MNKEMNVTRLRQAFVDAGITLEQALTIITALEEDVLNHIATKNDLDVGLSTTRSSIILELTKAIADVRVDTHKQISDVHKQIGDLGRDLTWKIYQAMGLGVFLMIAVQLPAVKRALGIE